MASHGVPRSGVSSERPTRRRRLKWWVRGGLAGLGVLAVLTAAALLVVTEGLDRPWVKRRVQALARASAGVDIDYRSARVSLLSGAEIEGLVVASPEAFRGPAPALLRVGHVQARWSLSSLLGHGPRLERLAVSDVAFAMVVDEHGRTSLDAWSTPSAPSPPLSQRAAAQLGATPPVGRIDVDRVALTLIRTEEGRVSERTEVRGLSAAIIEEPAAKGWRLRAGLGAPGTPLDLGITRQNEGAASAAGAKLWLTVDATSSEMSAAVDLHVFEQTLAPNLPSDQRFHAEATARFDTAAGQTEILLHETRADDGVVTADASLDLPDAGDPVVRSAQGDVDLARVLTWIPAGLVPVTAGRAQVRYKIASLILGPTVRLAEGGSIALDADLEGVRVNLPSGPIDLSKGELSLHGEQGPGGAIAGLVHAQFERLELGGPKPITAGVGDVEIRAQDLYVAPNDPLATRGDIALSVTLGSLDARAPRTRSVIDGLVVRAHTRLDGHAPYALEVDAAANRLRILDPGGRALVDAPARLQVGLRDVFADLAHPVASRGVASMTCDLGDVHAALDATKAADAVDFALRVDARSLKAVTPWLPPDLVAPWDRMAVTARSTGRIEHLGGSLPEDSERTPNCTSSTRRSGPSRRDPSR